MRVAHGKRMSTQIECSHFACRSAQIKSFISCSVSWASERPMLISSNSLRCKITSNLNILESRVWSQDWSLFFFVLTALYLFCKRFFFVCDTRTNMQEEDRNNRITWTNDCSYYDTVSHVSSHSRSAISYRITWFVMALSSFKRFVHWKRPNKPIYPHGTWNKHSAAVCKRSLS